MFEIKKKNEIYISGSKSYTHRLLIASALSNNKCILKNILESEDTAFTISALENLGIKIKKEKNNLIINGKSGIFSVYNKEIFLGNSGTSMRFLCSLATLGKGEYILNGTNRMKKRPIKELIFALNQIGANAISVNNNNCPPVKITSISALNQIRANTSINNNNYSPIKKQNKIEIDCSLSSQYLSSLLFIAPLLENGLEIKREGKLVSKNYIDMTIDIMKKFSIEILRESYDFFKIKGKQIYQGGSYEVEADASNASYFFAIAAMTNTSIKILKLKKESKQGDIKFLEILEKMGAKVFYEKDGIRVQGKKLIGIEADMSNMPDVVPTLAVLSAFATGKTIIKNIAHLAIKESNRIEATAKELLKLGAKVTTTTSSMTINGGFVKKGALINTYDDHRIAMSFAMASLMQKDIKIENKRCVDKSFPKFWQIFNNL